ncbi:MAG: PfkB family carbohydrate kinase [Candidatus Amulumruptor caecigallinarius]|nr:PfkB family carbohydrate kinase [Candidatus Amulumruptor caecigallinarius]MCM1397797.1 PfkB family carbohydrate kinase [Candidatus Amulumruptor caecigallinarius]MCM1454845.1 PfkB family carbohydrate kinase [bacterium]
MRKTAVIGAAALDINIQGDQPISITPDGRMLATAVALARAAQPVTFVSEAARDRVGDIIVDNLARAGVDTRCIDRYAGGHTPVNLRFAPDATHPEGDAVRYRAYPEENFDAVWPRVDADDIVVFGDYFAVAPRNSRFIREFITSCRQRRCITLYAPGFNVHAGKQLTPVKPALLDNLEWADITVATADEVEVLFGTRNLAEAYRDSISFYCPDFIGLSADSGLATLTYFSKGHAIQEPLADESMVTTAPGNASVIAAVVSGIIAAGVGCADFRAGLNDDMRLSILGNINPQS